MKLTVPSRGKHRGKHRSSSSSPRSGAAALMIGGLVAGTVATAGAATLGQEPSDDSSNLAADLTGAVSTATDTSTQDASRAAQLVSLHSGSLDQLREQPAADRSQARSAPADEDAVLTLLSEATFTGTTLEVEEPAETQEVEQAATQEQATEATAQQEQQTTQTQEAAPAQEQAQTTQAQTTQAQTTQTQAAPAAPAPVGGSVLGVAASYVGYPYVLYGTPPSSFDCSAYTWWVFQQAGISIPRSVAGQKGAVTPVSNPQPGDLVFYNDYHHVGIYAGNGMTYEALNPSSGVRYGPIISSNVWYGRVG